MLKFLKKKRFVWCLPLSQKIILIIVEHDLGNSLMSCVELVHFSEWPTWFITLHLGPSYSAHFLPITLEYLLFFRRDICRWLVGQKFYLCGVWRPAFWIWEKEWEILGACRRWRASKTSHWYTWIPTFWLSQIIPPQACSTVPSLGSLKMLWTIVTYTSESLQPSQPLSLWLAFTSQCLLFLINFL